MIIEAGLNVVRSSVALRPLESAIKRVRPITDILLTPDQAKPYSRPDAELQAELDIQRGAPIPPSPEETKLQSLTRPALARELLRDPLYTDERLLSGLPKRKLIRMVIQSRQRLAADAATERKLA